MKNDSRQQGGRPAPSHRHKRKKRWSFEEVTAAPPPTLVQGIPHSGRQTLFDFKRDDCPKAGEQQKSPQSVDADYGAIQRREAPQVPRIVAADSPAVNGFSITHEEFLNGKASRSL